MSEGTQRRLAAIVAADVAGYSRLMGQDERGTLAALKAHRAELIDDAIASHGGRIVKTTGDGMLAEFPSVVAAVDCCTAVQDGMVRRNAGIPPDEAIRFRIGIHLGDIIIDGGDIFGDGVNIAARLQEIGAPDGIAVSAVVHDYLDGRQAADFVDSGEHELKNIRRPIRVWQRVSQDRAAEPAPAASAPLPLPDKPSIAVLPFDNMSGDPEQEYFADGIAEDVITALSRFRSLFVIARNSSFSYKGISPDIRTVASDLGVRYVVEGSVRKAGDRVRITAQLIDAFTGNHLWAEKFDGTLNDIFDLQDRITEQIVVALVPEIEAREREQAQHKPPRSLNAWDLYQRGMWYYDRINQSDRTKAICLFEEAVEVDPNFALAHAQLAMALVYSIMQGYVEDRDDALAKARAAALRAMSEDPNEPLAHLALGRLHLFSGDFEMAIGNIQTAIACNPNLYWGYYQLGFAYQFGAGRPAQALPNVDIAIRLSPRDSVRWAALMLKGSVLRMLGRYDEAVAHCRQACQDPKAGYLPYMHLAAALAEAGRKDESQGAVKRALELQPSLTIRSIRNQFVGMHEASSKSLLGSMRKAGFPE